MTLTKRDHGGGLDAAIQHYGGVYEDWLDLSTGINPNPYSIPNIPKRHWHNLPDEAAKEQLLNAARNLWNVPENASIVPASGVSALIAILPMLSTQKSINILQPTYNEFAASFTEHNWTISVDAPVQIRVHPNNPDGKISSKTEIMNSHNQLTIIDESFCDVCPENSLADLAELPNYIILKGTGKFWGLAGLRLGFAITSSEIAQRIEQRLGPWNISGPAQFIGQIALTDGQWITDTRRDLTEMAQQLDQALIDNGLTVLGGTSLFRLAETKDARALHEHLCQQQILTRIFPYSKEWIRLGLPANIAALSRLKDALGTYK